MLRLLFILSILLNLTACKEGQEKFKFNESTKSLREPALKPFYHGVASGDPLSDRVIIWTRITPEFNQEEIEVAWEIAEDSLFKKITKKGVFTTTPFRDYTVKVDVTNLRPSKSYFYRFEGLDAVSIVGRTKTAAQDADTLRFGIVSCSNYEWGYFNAYKHLAKEENIDAVLHLGDYIYEYGPGTYGDTLIGRKNIPDHEIVNLEDYRTRYAQYRLDEDLRAVHARHPFINIWDDHEITNNAYKTGAQNHQPEKEGSYEIRKNVAKQAFYEWIPIRETRNHYRDFKFGSLASLFMLDERLEARTEQADSLTDPRLDDASHELLGDTQINWLTANLNETGSTWKIIGNQVIYSYLDWGYEDFHLNLDSWDGYPAEQQELAQNISQNTIDNVVFVTGDTHTAWAFEATNQPFADYNPNGDSEAFAVEFGVTSINSANANERRPTDTVKMHESKIIGSPLNPHLKYTNMRDHGYLLLELTDSLATAYYKVVNTLKEKDSKIYTDKIVKVKNGSTRLILQE